MNPPQSGPISSTRTMAAATWEIHMHVVTIRRAGRGWEYTGRAPDAPVLPPTDEAPHNALYFWVIGDPINQ